MDLTIAQFGRNKSKAELLKAAQDLVPLFPGLPATLGRDPTVDFLRKTVMAILTESKVARQILGVRETTMEALCNLDGLAANADSTPPAIPDAAPVAAADKAVRTTPTDKPGTSADDRERPTPSDTRGFDPLSNKGDTGDTERLKTPPRQEKQLEYRGSTAAPEDTPETWLNKIYEQYRGRGGRTEGGHTEGKVPSGVLDAYHKLMERGPRGLRAGGAEDIGHADREAEASWGRTVEQLVGGGSAGGRTVEQLDGGGPAGGPRALRFLKDARQRGIKFSGLVNESARNFIRNFEELAVLHGLSEGDRRMAIADLLEGPVARHYRMSKHLWPTWQVFRAEFLECYATKTTDAQMLKNIAQRSQHTSERPHLFIAAVREMAGELGHPIPDYSLLQIIKENLLPAYSSQLALFSTPDFSALEAACAVIERSLQTAKQFQPPPEYLLKDPDFGVQVPTQSRAAVAEVREEEEILAVTENCYNCNGPHRYKLCPHPLKVFCRFCGRREVTTAMCCRQRLVQPRASGKGPGPSSGTTSQRPSMDDELAELKKLVTEMHQHFTKIPKNG